MSFISDNILKKLIKIENSEKIKEELKKGLDQLKENLFYGQQLAHIGSWTHDIRNDEIFMSDEIYQIFGCSSQDFDGSLSSLYSFVHPDDLHMVRLAIESALEGGEYEMDYRIITKSGTTRYVHEKTKTLYDESRTPVKVIGILQDITEQKISENNLKSLEEDLNLAQRVAGVGSWKYDVISDEIFWSDEVYRIYGVAPESFERSFNSLLKLIHPEDREKMQSAVSECLGGRGYQLEYRIPQDEGLVKYVVTKGEPLFDKDGHVTGILGVLQDITEKKLLEDKLKKSYRNLAEAQQLTNTGSWEMDVVKGINYWSDETYRIFGIECDQYDQTHEGFLKFVHPDDIHMIHSVLDNPPREPFDMEFRIIRPDGSVRNLYQIIRINFDDQDRPVLIHGAIRDITERKELQRTIEQKQEEISRVHKRFQILVQESNDVFEILAPDGTIEYISEASERIIGYKPEERVGKKVFDFYSGEGQKKMERMLQSALSEVGKEIREDIFFRTKTGKGIYLEVCMQNLTDEPAINGIAVNFRDITKRVEMEKQISYVATHDELTGLPNKIYFKDKVELLCHQTKKAYAGFALMMLEIDGFKYINDALGYQVGDLLIIRIAERLRSLLGGSDYLCRYSGVRFAFIVQSGGADKRHKEYAEDIMELFDRSFKVDEYELSVNVNMGISLYDANTQDVDTLIMHAESALFWSKDETRSRFGFYSSDISIQNYKQFELRNDLHRAIDMNQLRAYYQPIVNLAANEIIAVEALIRWEHPEWGMVSPKEFITLAEETGFIINIGNWILREVCCNYRQWLDKGLPAVKAAVNFSCIQFFQNDFVDNIKKIIDEFKLDPNFLVMEITESILMNKTDKVISDIKRLQSLGIQVALDDFGSGYSSLAYLNSLNIDIIKMDGSFVRNINADETSTVIIRNIVNMAKELKIKLVAEGIENWEQLNYLREIKCYTGQGYIYSRPVPSEDFERMLARRKLKPVIVNNAPVSPRDDRRSYFRLKFHQLLQAELMILKIRGKNVNVGNTKVLIKNIGAGGLCFVTNLQLPVEKDFLLQFTAELIGVELKLYGYPVWGGEFEDDLFQYGVEFTMDENERGELIRILNLVQIKMRNNILFAEGSFAAESPRLYFKLQLN